jgi:ribose 1,5-bisphosphokinase PhnN
MIVKFLTPACRTDTIQSVTVTRMNARGCETKETVLFRLKRQFREMAVKDRTPIADLANGGGMET